MEQHRRFPLNTPDGFYVVDGACMACTAPEEEAPDLMTYSDAMHCYFHRQPYTPAELQQAVLAVTASCCGGVRYGGTDPHIIRRLVEYGEAEKCDNLALSSS